MVQAMQKPEMVEVPADLLQWTVKYIQTRPWEEVNVLMDKWRLFEMSRTTQPVAIDTQTHE